MKRLLVAVLISTGLAALPVAAEEPASPPRPDKKPAEISTSLALPALSKETAPAPTATKLAPGIFIQLASLTSMKEATAAWSKLQSRHAVLLSDMRLTVEPADLGSRGWYYRVQTGPFPNRATAKDMCWQLKTKQQDCIILRR
ncbi:MAG: SPOR domain-containing protein [Rhodospirillales bacterium]|nr:SPOR domain-containing protein [Rhodospirillales bacterium]